MPEQPTELQRINWSECFAFTEIFRTFKMAIHPSKLGLALVGLLLTGLFGLLLDAIWSDECKPLDGEVNAFWQVPDINQWREQTREDQLLHLQKIYKQMAVNPPENMERDFIDDPDKAIDDALYDLEKKYKDAIREANESNTAETAQKFKTIYAEIQTLEPQGVFETYISFEHEATKQLITAAQSLNFLGLMDEVLRGRTTPDINFKLVKTGPKGFGILPCIMLMARAEQWLATEHLFFYILFGIFCLAIWALIGGAICRIAALNVARDERISPKMALAFAGRKFVGFLTAPLLPIGLIVIIGIFIFFGGVFTAIPYVGEILGGLGMILALLGGFVMALVMIGAVGGFSLLWPTIAVEGSDSFDAMSRSYSYVYTKPWRAAFYAAVALVYGALCYLFVRFFLLILLKATRFFLGLGITGFGWFSVGRPGTGIPGATKLDVLWPNPTFDDLMASGWPFGLENWDIAGRVLIGFWVLLAVLLLWAFVLSFYFSGSTIIYYLLRRQVDATDLEEVYVEEEDEEEEEEAEPAAPGTPESSAPSGSSGPPESLASPPEQQAEPPASPESQQPEEPPGPE